MPNNYTALFPAMRITKKVAELQPSNSLVVLSRPFTQNKWRKPLSLELRKEEVFDENLGADENEYHTTGNFHAIPELLTDFLSCKNTDK